MPALYIADGHHRSAAAARVAAARRRADPSHSGAESYNYFLAVAFPHHQLRILDYNRVVKDLKGLGLLEFQMRIGKHFSIRASDTAVRPARHGEFGLYLPKHWYRLEIKPELAQPADPVQAAGREPARRLPAGAGARRSRTRAPTSASISSAAFAG